MADVRSFLAADPLAPLADDDPLSPLKIRVDALFTSAAGRVGNSREELEQFVGRLSTIAQAYVRERCDEPAAPDLKRQRLPSVVCSGGWESRRTLEQLEATHGDGAYQEYELILPATSCVHSRVLRVREFSDYYFSSGRRGRVGALARWIWLREPLTRAGTSLSTERGDVLELGAGVGLAGLAAAYVARRVVLTDNEPLLLPNLRHNAGNVRRQLSEEDWEEPATLEVAQLDWSDPPADLVAAHGTFDVILASDVVYSSGAVAGLVGAVRALLKPGGELLMSYAGGRHGQVQFKAELEAAGASCKEKPVPAAYLAGTAQQGTAEEVAAHPFFVLSATWPG